MAFIYYLFLIIASFILLPTLIKSLYRIFYRIFICFYDLKYNINIAKIVPLKEAKISELEINSYVIEIPTKDSYVIY